MIEFKDIEGNKIYARKIDCVIIPSILTNPSSIQCRIVMQSTISMVTYFEAERVIKLLKDLDDLKDLKALEK